MPKNFDIILNNSELKELAIKRIDENNLSIVAINRAIGLDDKRGANMGQWLNRSAPRDRKDLPWQDEVIAFCGELGIDIRVQLVVDSGWEPSNEIGLKADFKWRNMKRKRSS